MSVFSIGDHSPENGREKRVSWFQSAGAVSVTAANDMGVLFHEPTRVGVSQFPLTLNVSCTFVKSARSLVRNRLVLTALPATVIGLGLSQEQ